MIENDSVNDSAAENDYGVSAAQRQVAISKRRLGWSLAVAVVAGAASLSSGGPVRAIAFGASVFALLYGYDLVQSKRLLAASKRNAAFGAGVCLTPSGPQ